MLEAPVKLNLLAKGRITGDRDIVTELDSAGRPYEKHKNAMPKAEIMIRGAILQREWTRK
jgi:hypothetical protein